MGSHAVLRCCKHERQQERNGPVAYIKALWEFILSDRFGYAAVRLAYLLTGNEKYATMHQQVHDYAYGHFHDPAYGEWYGYLHRDGTPAQTAKGNLFKGPFHLPRQEWFCWWMIDCFEKGTLSKSGLAK